MAGKMHKIGNSKFVNPSKILSANVYQKDGSTRVALQMDAKEPTNQVVYSDPFASPQEAENFILSLPIGE